MIWNFILDCLVFGYVFFLYCSVWGSRVWIFVKFLFLNVFLFLVYWDFSFGGS